MNQKIQLTDIAETLMNANSKALATNGSEGLNVVPVSTIKVLGPNKILLVDYFFDKTRKNLKESESCALVSWRGPVGFQVKAKHTYKTSGHLFTEITKWAKEKYPNRTVHGIVELEPTEIFDISL